MKRTFTDENEAMRYAHEMGLKGIQMVLKYGPKGKVTVEPFRGTKTW